MKKQIKSIVVLAAAVIILFLGDYAVVHMSYYPMGGEVTIVDKSKSRNDYCIVIKQSPSAKFTLSCSESEYYRVNVGDTVNCDRMQSALTHKGEVHKVKPVK